MSDLDRGSVPRVSLALIAFLVAAAAPGAVSSAAAQGRAWEVPRTADGRPDLQGNWTNQSLTPIQRREDQPLVYTPQQVAELERGYEDRVARGAEPSDPERGLIEAQGNGVISAADSYNNVFFETGSRVAVVNGEPRASLITRPVNGRIPPLTPAAQERRRAEREALSRFGPSDGPELRALSDRCLTSYGSPMGPPMLPNGGYNSNYTIVQTPDYVMIMTEMVHDYRIIHIGSGPKLPADIRPWFGDSQGHWEGDVLVVETTNLNPLQPYSSPEMKVTERFSRMSQEALLYEFTVDDPATYVEPWGGQIPMMAMHDQLYEYACHEGNYAMEGILKGARFEEGQGR
jgi:hypothetical protein